jgi:imidazolonepropionase
VSLLADTLWTDARLATLAPGQPGLGTIEDGAIAARDGRIVYAGPKGGLAADLQAREVRKLDGRWVTPGLIDCHTHLVYGGDRAREFELRLEGASYEQIAREGGGIVSTVRATRAASEAELDASARRRLRPLLAEGVTTVEIKSGYGLDVETELRCLRVARALGATEDVGVRTTCLAAHAFPPEFSNDRAAYLDLVCERLLPAVAQERLADAVDGFLENIAFSAEEIVRVFERAQALGLPLKLHADQLTNGGGAALAARFSALSADHLEYTDEAGAAAMAGAGTVAVILPAAFYTLREKQLPLIDAFRRHGVPMAVATDCNPGTAPMTSLLLAMNMAATLFRMRVDEVLAGVTREAARALGLLAETGTLETGKACDLAIWDVERPAELVYRIGFNPLFQRVRHGR